MKQETWKDRAHAQIRECYLVWLDISGQHPSPNMREEDKRTLLKMIRKSYPFGERDMWPYTVWLREVKKVEKFLFPDPQQPVNDGLFAVGEPGE